MTTATDPVSIYDQNADAFAVRYEAVSSEALLAEVLSIVPRAAAGRLALDIGAGTGRDAAWLSGLGYEVVAAEPAAGMRRVAAARHGNARVRWIDDSLPGLERTHSLGLSFDLILLSAVWQHVAPEVLSQDRDVDEARRFASHDAPSWAGGARIEDAPDIDGGARGSGTVIRS